MNLTSLLLPEDFVSVNELVQSYLKAWNEQDADQFVKHFTDYAEFTDSLGQVANGKPAIHRLIDFQFSITNDSATIDFEELYLRYLKPDLVIGTGRWIFSMEDQGKKERKGIVHLICLKLEDGIWKLIFVHSLDSSNPSLG